jgi:hypothetical protein
MAHARNTPLRKFQRSWNLAKKKGTGKTPVPLNLILR